MRLTIADEPIENRSADPNVLPRDIGIFELNDFTEFWAGESLEACVLAAMEQSGLPREAVFHEGFGQRLSQAEMEHLRFVDENGSVRSFAEQLAREITTGRSFPCLFAADDY